VPITLEERTALALSALGEVTDPAEVGELLGADEVEPGVVDLRFACTLAAYAGWHWTVSTSDLPDGEVTVLEVELLPGDGALLAPPWVPWAERLADWRRQHPDERHPGEGVDDEDADDDDVDDEDDLAVDDELDELDETELEGVESPEESEQDTGDIDDEDEDEDDSADDEDSDDDDLDDDRPARPGEVDRSL
jgi:hypothetical protein